MRPENSEMDNSEQDFGGARLPLNTSVDTFGPYDSTQRQGRTFNLIFDWISGLSTSRPPHRTTPATATRAAAPSAPTWPRTAAVAR